MIRRFALAFIVLLIGTPVLAQQIPPGSPHPCKIRIVVTDDKNHGVPDATVDLMDATGFSPSGSSKQTLQEGRVDFSSFTGLHRIRITGGEIFPYEGDFEVAPNESSHIEYIRVKMKPPVGGDTPAPTGPPTAPARMKIPSAAQKEYEKGNKAAEKKDWAAAADAFREAVKLYPDYDLAYNALGIVLSAQGYAGFAKEAFEKAIAITPEYAMADRNLARILLTEQNWKRADELLRKSLQTEPVNAWALTNVAYCELQLHNFSDAAAMALKVHDVPHSGYESAHFIAAVAFEELGKKPDARAQYDLYLKEAPTGENAARAQQALARLSQP